MAEGVKFQKQFIHSFKEINYIKKFTYDDKERFSKNPFTIWGHRNNIIFIEY